MPFALRGNWYEEELPSHPESCGEDFIPAFCFDQQGGRSEPTQGASFSHPVWPSVSTSLSRRSCVLLLEVLTCGFCLVTKVLTYGSSISQACATCNW